jgi:hypothetical protein
MHAFVDVARDTPAHRNVIPLSFNINVRMQRQHAFGLENQSGL